MITKEMILGEILQAKSGAVKILMGLGMYGLGCPSAKMESLEDACMVHGLSVDEVLAKLNL